MRVIDRELSSSKVTVLGWLELIEDCTREHGVVLEAGVNEDLRSDILLHHGDKAFDRGFFPFDLQQTSGSPYLICENPGANAIKVIFPYSAVGKSKVVLPRYEPDTAVRSYVIGKRGQVPVGVIEAEDVTVPFFELVAPIWEQLQYQPQKRFTLSLPGQRVDDVSNIPVAKLRSELPDVDVEINPDDDIARSSAMAFLVDFISNGADSMKALEETPARLAWHREEGKTSELPDSETEMDEKSSRTGILMHLKRYEETVRRLEGSAPAAEFVSGTDLRWLPGPEDRAHPAGHQFTSEADDAIQALLERAAADYALGEVKHASEIYVDTLVLAHSTQGMVPEEWYPRWLTQIIQKVTEDSLLADSVRRILSVRMDVTTEDTERAMYQGWSVKIRYGVKRRDVIDQLQNHYFQQGIERWPSLNGLYSLVELTCTS